MTQQEAKAAVVKYGSQRKACDTLKIGRHTLSDALSGFKTTTKVNAIVAQPKQESESSGSAVSGFSLKNARISDHKPADSVKRLIYQLKKGAGFSLDQLSEHWGISCERIKREAKRFECLKYVETDPGNWVLCVMHPDTAEEYRKDA